MPGALNSPLSRSVVTFLKTSIGTTPVYEKPPTSPRKGKFILEAFLLLLLSFILGLRRAGVKYRHLSFNVLTYWLPLSTTHCLGLRFTYTPVMAPSVPPQKALTQHVVPQLLLQDLLTVPFGVMEEL